MLRVLEQSRIINQQGYNGTEQESESSCRKCSQRKPLEHFNQGDHQAAKSKTDHHPDQTAMAGDYKVRLNLAHCVATNRAQTQKKDTDDPKSHKSGYYLLAGCAGWAS